MWLILDKADASKDRDLSEHVLHVHRYGIAPHPSEGPHLTSTQLRAYVAAAKTFQPIIPKELIGNLMHGWMSMPWLVCRLYCRRVCEYASREFGSQKGTYLHHATDVDVHSQTESGTGKASVQK